MDQTKTEPRNVTLTDFLRTHTRFIINPIVDFMARYGVKPDVLTVLGMAFHFFFAWLISVGQMRWAAVAMFFLAPLDAFAPR